MPSVCWRRHDQPGHEVATLTRSRLPGVGWEVTGTLAMAFEGAPCDLSYVVMVDPAWRTLSGSVVGAMGGRRWELVIASADGRWRIGTTEYPGVEGCVDLDLNFSPVTNLLPIRRLGLEIGESATVRAAWLRFPSMALEPLEQVYRRTGEREYEYESAGGAFRARLQVNEHGLVTKYGDIWTAEAESSGPPPA